MRLANPATAICVLSPNSATNIKSNVVKKMLWFGRSTISAEPSSLLTNKAWIPNAPNSTATRPAVTRSGTHAATPAPNNTASVLSKTNAVVAPRITGQWRCRAARAIHTSWLLSPNSASAIRVKVDRETGSDSSGGMVKNVHRSD